MILLLRQPILPAKIQMPQHRPEYFALPELHLSACSKGYRPLSVEVVGCHAGKSHWPPKRYMEQLPLCCWIIHCWIHHPALEWKFRIICGVYICIYIYISPKKTIFVYSLIPFQVGWIQVLLSKSFKYDNVYAAVCIYIYNNVFKVKSHLAGCWILHWWLDSVFVKIDFTGKKFAQFPHHCSLNSHVTYSKLSTHHDFWCKKLLIQLVWVLHLSC